MARKNVWVFFFLCVFFFSMTGCSLFKTTTETEISITIETTELTSESALTLKLRAIYEMAVEQTGFDGTYEEWLETIKGADGLPGVDGREIELQVASGFIQWRFQDSLTWTNLISLEALRGETGISGKQVILRVQDGYIQWQYIGDSTWTNLIAIELLIGNDGKAVQFQVDEGFIQYQYIGDASWINLIELASLIGPQGIPGKEIELRVNDTYLEWRYLGSDTWYFLYDLITLKGQDAEFPIISITEDGYWIIDGVVQEQKAYTVEKFTVTFDPTGGLMPDGYPLSVEVDKGSSMNLPIPTKLGYVFTGWITGYNIFDVTFNNYLPITKNTNLIALWEVDRQIINDFFEQVNYDHAFNYTMNVNFSNGVNNYFYDLNQFYYLNVSGSSYYDFLQSQTVFQLPYSGLYDYTSEKYTQYENGTYYIVQGNTLYYSPTYDSYNHLLNDINPNLFSLTDTDLIYEYEGDMSIFEEPFLDALEDYELLFVSIIEYSEQYCYLDILNNTLTYYVTGSTEIPTVGVATLTMSVVYEFNEFDETTMTLPFDEIKQNVVDHLNSTIAEKYLDPQLDYVLEASLQEFETLVIAKQDELALITTLPDLVYFYTNSFAQIQYFEFMYDDLAIYVDQTVAQFIDYLNYKSSNATTDSITAMNSIYMQFETLVINMTYSDMYDDYGFVLYIEFVNQINTAHIIDIDKLYFNRYRETTANSLSRFNTELIETLFLTSEETGIYMGLIAELVYNLNAQTTMEDLLFAYDEAILELTSVTFTGYLETGMLYMQTDYLINDLLSQSYLATDEEAYINYINSITFDLASGLITDYNEWVLEVISVINLSQSYLINEVMPITTAELNQFISILGPQISDEDLAILELELADLLLLLPQCLRLSHYNELIQTFYINASKIPYNQWKIDKTEALGFVVEEYDYLILTASSAAFALLTADLNDFNLALASLAYEDYEALDILVTNTITNFTLDYESAPEYVDLYLMKIDYLDRFEEFYLVGIPYVDLEMQSTEDLDETYYYYRYLLRMAMDESTLYTFYEQGCIDIKNQPYSFLPFDSYVNELIALQTDYYDSWLITYGLTSIDADYVMSNFIENMDYVVSPYDARFLFENYRNTLDYYILYEMATHYSSIAEDIYHNYLTEINTEYYSFLDAFFSDVLDLIYQETVWTNFQIIIDNFVTDVEEWINTYYLWEITINSAITQVEEEYAYLYLTASSAAKLLLDDDLNNFNLSFASIAQYDYDGINLLVESTINTFSLHYESDPAYTELYMAKVEYLSKWEDFYLIGLPYVDLDYSTTEGIEDVYKSYRSDIRFAMVINDIQIFYYQGVQALVNIESTYLSIDPLKTDFIVTLTGYVDNWIVTYGIYSAQTESYLNDFVNLVNSAISPYYVYYQYLDYKYIIDEQILMDMEIYYQDVLYVAYLDYINTLDSMYHYDVDMLYFEHSEQLAYITIWEDFQVVIDNFHASVYLLVNP